MPMWSGNIMGRIIFNQNDLVKATKLILNHDLDLKKVRLKGKYGVIYVKRTPYRIHRLLGEYYFGKLDGYHIHHLDENPLNNLMSNLIKISPSEHTKKYHNNIQKYRKDENKIKTQMIMTEKIKRNDVTSKEVIYLRNSGLTYIEIAKKLNCGYNTVLRRIKKIDWSKDE